MSPARSALPIVLLLAAAAGCGDRPPPRPNIVLFTVDTLRADRVGCYGNAPAAGSPTPFADRLAAEGVAFEQCFATRGLTHPSLASLLTGKFPITHGLRHNGMALPPAHSTLPALLKRAGYRTAGFASNLDIGHWPFWVRGFDVAEDGVEGRLKEEGYTNSHAFQRVWDDRTVAKAIRWIEGLPADGTPFFLWVHLYDVHDPYTPLEEDAARFRDPGYAGPLRHPTAPPGPNARDRITKTLSDWTLGRAEYRPADVAQVKALYDAQLAAVDAKLGRVHAALERRGLLQGALVAYSADHGDELGDHHRYFAHGASIYDSVLRIPLIVAWPGRAAAGGRVRGLAQNLDLFATLLEAAGAEPPAGTEGVSLLRALADPAAPTGREFAFGEWEDLIYSVSDGAWKYIHNPQGARPQKPPYSMTEDQGFPYQCHELYRVEVDPLEQRNLFDRKHPEARRLLQVLETFLADPAHRGAMDLGGGADPNLAALGYTGTTKERDIVTIDCGDH